MTTSTSSVAQEIRNITSTSKTYTNERDGKNEYSSN